MFRRIATAAPALAAASAKRFYTPAEDLKKLFASDFEKAAYPCDVVASDGAIFAKFLFKASEPKAAFDVVLKDFAAIDAASKKLPVFWERSVDVATAAELKGLAPQTIFTMKWMAANGMLEQLVTVRAIYETLVNAQKKKVVAKISVAATDKDNSSVVNAAKEVAKKLHAQNKSLAQFSLDVVVSVDADFVSGFAVDVAGLYHSTAKGVETAAAGADDVDYTNVPPRKVLKTKWEDSVETEVLAKYVESLSLYDLEEQKNGV